MASQNVSKADLSENLLFTRLFFELSVVNGFCREVRMFGGRTSNSS